jgi:SAM-dependent methyltransferase/uncharacterized protein YbaR (Trm112 family)
VGDLDGLLRCPITRTPLLSATPDQLRSINEAISRGALSHADGSRVNLAMETAYVSEDGSHAYGVKDEIVLLLPALAVVLSSNAAPSSLATPFSAEKKLVQDFYDQAGWKTIDGVFLDSLKFADRRPVVREYFQRIHQRARRCLNPTGRFILDAASGPIPHPEQSVYSEGFDYRICLDFSFDALRAARTKLGAKGIYILGDLTKLPLADHSLDAVISLHTLYHVPADEQKNALQEIYRVLKPGARAVVVYSWGKHSVLMRLASPDRRINRAIIKAAAVLKRPRKGTPDESSEGQPSDPPVNLYFHVHPYSWFLQILGTLGSFKLACWRSVSVEFQRAYIHDWLYGRQILATLAWFEDRFPWFFGRLGQYPMFVIRKPSNTPNE